MITILAVGPEAESLAVFGASHPSVEVVTAHGAEDALERLARNRRIDAVLFLDGERGARDRAAHRRGGSGGAAPLRERGRRRSSKRREAPRLRAASGAALLEELLRALRLGLAPKGKGRLTPPDQRNRLESRAPAPSSTSPLRRPHRALRYDRQRAGLSRRTGGQGTPVRRYRSSREARAPADRGRGIMVLSASMGGCGSGGGCGVGNAYNPGQYVGIRINEHEDGRNVLCDTMGIEVDPRPAGHRRGRLRHGVRRGHEPAAR